MLTPDRYFLTRLPYDPGRRAVWKEICCYLQRHYFPDAVSVLDLGAGYGDFINQVDARERHAVDMSGDLAAYFHADVSLHVQSCTSLPQFDPDSFDVVFASNLFEHLTRQEVVATLSEAMRVLKAGGSLVLLQPNFKYCASSYFDDYTHVQVFTHISLADLLAACGFDVISVEARFLPLTMKTRLPKHRLLVRAYLASPIRPGAGQMLIVARKAPRDAAK